MHRETFEGRATAFCGAACLAAAAAFFAVCPGQALAADRVAHSTNEAGVETSYYSVDDAVAAGSVDVKGADGPVIVMDTDWKVGKDSNHDARNADGSISVESGKKLTIDMNGHTIENENYTIWVRFTLPTIAVKDNASLTLMSSKSETISYKGFKGRNGDRVDLSTTTGGLITNATNKKSALMVGKSATLTLDNVTVAGCEASQDISGDEAYVNAYPVKNTDGGITLAQGSTLNMKNKASVEHNRTSFRGGGVYTEGDNVTLNMDNASIHDNYAGALGGGICMSGSAAAINMDNGAAISNNIANDGGGIYFMKSQFNVICSSGEAFVSGNRAEGTTKGSRDGGGIFASFMFTGTDKGLIKGITISDNYSAYDGGGLELDQENTTLENCIIKGNKCRYEGGGIFSNNDDNVINGCVITGNACNLVGENNAGGGVFVSCTVDLKLAGTCLIYGNTRGENSGNADDLFLNENWGATAKAYVTGGVSKGSKVGIRTGIGGDRQIGDHINNETKDSFFMDLGGYYVSYGSDHGGDMWQRHRALQYLLQVNGQGANRYGYGASVVANAASTNPDKVFWYWDANSTWMTGLYPVSDYITSENLHSPLLSFAMPQCDVNLQAIYADRVKKGLLAVDAPVAGEELPTTASFARADGGVGGIELNSLPVTWYELADDGSKVAAAGKAKAGASYVASVSIPQQKELGLYFSSGIAAADVTVRAAGSDAQAASASVDSGTGALTVETSAFKTKGLAAQVETGTVTIEMENGGLNAAIGSGDEDEIPGAGVGASGEGSGAAETTPIDTVQVSYAEGSDSVTVAAPACEGYNFCYWSDVPEGVEADSDAGTASFDAGDIKSALKLGAVYTPVVTEVDLGMAAPVAGKKLASAVTSIWVKGTGDTELDLLGDFTDAGSLPVTWSPNANGASGKAACATAYAATAALDEDGDAYLDVEKVISPNVVVKANGVELPGAAAGFAVVDGKLSLCAAFPATVGKDAANKAAAKAVTGKTVSVKAAKSGKTKKTVSARVKAAASASGAKAKFKVLSASKQLKVNAKTGKVTLKKGAKAGKTYTAKFRVSYGKYSKAVKVKFVVK